MAQQNSPMDRNRYSCSICLDLLRDPVTLPCSHSYCLGCITDYWNTEDVRGVYSCPQCRQTFTPRPALVKNTVLADVMEDLKKTKLQDAPPDHCYAGPEDVGCDVCTGRKTKAIKSCLVCLVSFCDEHIQSHYQVAGLKRHKLVEPTADIQDNICPRHNEVMKMFCRQDRQSICYLCVIDEHRGHDTITAEAERIERQKDLSGRQRVTQAQIQKVQEDVHLLQQEMDSINQSADEALTGIDEIFAEMIRPLESQRFEVKEKIRTEQKTVVGRLHDLQKDLEQEIVEMKRTVDDLEHLSQTQSDIYFLQKYPQNLRLKEYAGLPARDADPMQYLKNVTVALAKMKGKLKVFLKDEIPHISLAVAKVDFIRSQQSEPRTRAHFLQYSCEMSFDPKTKTKCLSLSEGNRRVTLSKLNQPERSVGNCLSKCSLTGRQYWEVNWTTRYVSIAVGYKDSSWNDQGFGNDDKSWALSIYPTATAFKHNRIITKIPGPHSSRVGVYLDYWAGILCFYNISDTMALLHKVQTTFTQPLYAGIWLCDLPGGTAEFCHPLQA